MSGYRWWFAVAVLLAAAFVTLISRPEAAVAAAHLGDLPASIAGWTAQDSPIEPRLVAASRVDSYVNRVYRRDGDEIGLYVGYYKSQRAGDSVHSPKNCLPGGGWQAVRSVSVALPLAGGDRPEVNLYVVENERHRLIVLYWYQSHGDIVASEYAAKLHTIRDAIALHRTDSALVRVTVPVTTDEAAAIQSAVDFASLVAPHLNLVLPR
jgi:EpsI family protein